MSPEIIGIIGIALLIFFMFMGMWLGAAMAVIGFFGFMVLTDVQSALAMIGSVPYSSVATEALAVVPLFIFMGTLVAQTGVAGELYKTAYSWLGHLKGGLAISTVAACGGFAAICGSSVACSATMGKIAVPEMKKYLYDEGLSTGSVAAGGTIGILIPPSVGFIMYGLLTEQSIGRLFMAGIIPGILQVAFFAGAILIWCRINPSIGPAGPKISFKEKLLSLKGTWAMLALFALVMGGIYRGWFTTTEAGAVGAFGAIGISFLARKLNRKNLTSSILDALQNAAMVVLIMASTFVFMKFMTLSQLPSWLAEQIIGVDFPPWVVLALIISLYIVLGMFLDVLSAVILTLPILYPIVTSLGFDPIWYGVIMVMVLEMGMITPPVGINTFVVAGGCEVPVKTVFRGVIPFVFADIVEVFLLLFFPSIALFLPNSMI